MDDEIITNFKLHITKVADSYVIFHSFLLVFFVVVAWIEKF